VLTITHDGNIGFYNAYYFYWLSIRINTLIWIMSDNGFNFGHHGIWGKGNGTFPQNIYMIHRLKYQLLLVIQGKF